MLSASETLAAELKNTGVNVSVMMCTFYRSNIWKHTLGNDIEREAARRLGDGARLTLDKAAKLTLTGVAKGHFYIVFPALAVFLWKFKRWTPRIYLRFVPIFYFFIKRKVYAQS